MNQVQSPNVVSVWDDKKKVGIPVEALGGLVFVRIDHRELEPQQQRRNEASTLYRENFGTTNLENVSFVASPDPEYPNREYLVVKGDSASD